MKRRNFLQASLFTGLGFALNSCSSEIKEKELAERMLAEKRPTNLRGTFSQKDNIVSIYTEADIKPTRIFHITDTHLSIDDERGVKYKEFSKRMGGAYKVNSHFQTGESVSTSEGFEQTLVLAKEQKADFIALTGDIFSFPSEAGVEWALEKLNSCGIPFAYVAGNHDWHYEGMEGSSKELRDIWTERHLKPMYQGNNPLYASYNINGIQFTTIDNSTYEILPEQLDYLREQIIANRPIVLLMHIPLYMPGRPMGFGCANPNWSEASDRNFKIERREKWRKGGHTKTTMDFYEEVFNAPNILTTLTGHTHSATIDVKGGIPQVVSAHNATGYYTDITIDCL